MVKVFMACGLVMKPGIGHNPGLRSHIKRCRKVEGGCKELKRISYDLEKDVIE